MARRTHEKVRRRVAPASTTNNPDKGRKFRNMVIYYKHKKKPEKGLILADRGRIFEYRQAGVKPRGGAPALRLDPRDAAHLDAEGVTTCQHSERVTYCNVTRAGQILCNSGARLDVYPTSEIWFEVYDEPRNGCNV